MSFFCEMFFSLSLDLRVLSSLRMMRSSSCLDLVSPMLLMSSCSSFDMFEEAMFNMNSDIVYNHVLLNPIQMTLSKEAMSG